MLRKIFTSTLLSLVMVGGFFVNIHLDPNTNGVVSFVGETYAADCGEPGQAKCTQDQEMVKMYNKLIGAINIILELLTFFVSPAIMLAGWLMSPDWTSGDLFNLRPVLHNLWILVSNVTYFIYAILLIFIALATIFNSQNYGYKKLLPRLALGIILVPLTWWFTQFIISLSTVVTASVMNLPAEVMDRHMTANSSPDAWWNTDSVPTKFQFFTDPGTVTNGAPQQYKTECPGSSDCTSPKKILTNSSGIYGSLLIYGNALFKLNEAKRLSTVTDVLKTVVGLINQGLLAVIMFIVFGFLVIALVFMLMMRAIKLWFYAIFSPLLTLKYVIGDGLFGGKENSDSFEIKEFVGLAFVPALVGLALSFGIVIITLLQSPVAGNSNTPCTDAMMEADREGCTIMNIMGSPDNYIKRKVITFDNEVVNGEINVTEVVMGGITYTFYGSAINKPVTGASVSEFKSALSSTGSVFGTLIIDIIALIFLWAAFVAAKNISKVAKAAFEPFEKMGNQVGKMAMSIPKHTPLPLPGGSISGMQKTIELGQNKLDEIHRKQEMEVIGKQFPGLVDGLIKPVNETAIKNAQSTTKGQAGDAQIKTMLEATSQAQSGTKYMDINYQKLTGALKEVFGDGKVKDDDLKRYFKDRGANSKEQEVLAKMYKGESMNQTDREMAYNANARLSGGGSSTSSNTEYKQAPIVSSKDGKTVEKFEYTFNQNLKVQTNLDGSGISNENLTKLRDQVKSEKISEDEFTRRFTGVDDTVKKKIIEQIKKDNPNVFAPPKEEKK